MYPFRYRGYYYDQETGLYYLGSRYYSPTIGRFISADEPVYLGANGNFVSYNLFAYCVNDPINSADPTGHFLISTAVIIGAIAGGIIGAVVGGLSAYHIAKNNGAAGWALAGGTALGTIGGGAIGAAAGYGVGYLAGGTYANGLVAKSEVTFTVVKDILHISDMWIR